MEAISFFKSLKPEDWDKKATEKWTVKDVLSHLVGWEREVAIELRNTFEKEKEPWFMKTNNYTNFNETIFNEFRNNSPEELLAELGKWAKITEKEIQDIGKDRIRQHKHMDWVFDEGEESHFGHHIKQVKKALKRF